MSMVPIPHGYIEQITNRMRVFYQRGDNMLLRFYDEGAGLLFIWCKYDTNQMCQYETAGEFT